MIHSHLTYSLLVWGYNCKRIEKLQKRIIRIISLSKYNAHTEPLFKSLNILKFHDMLKLNTLKFYYKYNQGILPQYFYSFNFETITSIHSYNTRQSSQLHIERTRTHYTDNIIIIYLPLLINSTPSILINKIYTHSPQGFTANAKRYLFSLYSNTCSIVHCYICDH